jgi:hypothetical protein
LLAALAVAAILLVDFVAGHRHGPPAGVPGGGFAPAGPTDTGGMVLVATTVPPWGRDATLPQIAARFRGFGRRQAAEIDRTLASGSHSIAEQVAILVRKATYLSYEGDVAAAYETLTEARRAAERDPAVAAEQLYTLIYSQGVAALRLGETENCVKCRTVSACILPIDAAAVHTKPQGSRTAIERFTEYLKRFPDDLEVRWLLNLAHMTLGEYPAKVDPRHLVPLDRFTHAEADPGRFRDVSFDVGLEHWNEAGGAVMDDFDNDGWLDLVTGSFCPWESMAYFKNTGRGRFSDRTRGSGLTGQLGSFNFVQGDYNNDGFLDLFVCRGAWFPKHEFPPSLLRNNGNGTFTDVTRAAGMDEPFNSNAAQWADYDNDGWLDLFVCCERQPCRLYHNQHDGTFKERGQPAGLVDTPERFCKAATWIDYDRDDYPDLFASYLDGSSVLFRNERNGSFSDATEAAGIDGPRTGFSCWTFDYDNDGWPDLFATCYERTVAEVVKGLLGQPRTLNGSKLYRNTGQRSFEDVTEAAGLDDVYGAMGSNFGDLDNDGFLDMYLGTGDPSLATLVPNRMFKNLDGQRFTDVSAVTGTAHLQKGHGVAFGDWDHDGSVDLFVELGGAVPSDRYHNALFRNPGHDNRWLTLKLVGKKSNRSAVGAGIKVVTAGKSPRTVYRWVSSGSSFGGNPLRQTIGLGRAERVASLEIRWPTSRTTQTFRSLPVDRAFEITELDPHPRPLDYHPAGEQRITSR